MQTIIIDNVKHTVLTTQINWSRLRQIDMVHSLGTIYVNGKFGYVTSGYNWLRFRIEKYIK